MRDDSDLAADLRIPLDRLTRSPALSGPTARDVQVSPDGQRVGYLRFADDDRYRLDLWVFERRTGRVRCLIDARAFGDEPPLSAAEAARRERARVGGLRGIVGYQWAPDGRHLLFELGQALHLATLDARGRAEVREILREPGLIDARLSPRGRYVAFVQGQNLHVLDLRTGRRRALTADGGGTVHNGESEFVAQEEMDQPHGYWWSPDESCIAFKRFDEAGVAVRRRFEIQADRTEVVRQRYPVAGGRNVAVRLGVVSIGRGTVRWIDLGDDPDVYLPRVQWLPDGRSLSWQRQSRDQKSLELRRVTLRSLRQATLCVERSDTWVELHDDLRFLRRQPAFVWAGDREGRKHLELVGLDGRVRHALTAGDWQVDELLAVDEDAGWVYLAGDQGLSLERHVWRVRLDGSTARRPERISTAGATHLAAFPSDGPPRLWVDTASAPDAPPSTAVRDTDGAHLAWIEENRLDASHPYHPYLAGHASPVFGTTPADDGTPLNWSLLRPPGFDPTRRYPVMVYVYGGPGVQVVGRRWGDLFLQAIARRGYLVYSLDNRGSARRGRAFSDAIHGCLGAVEVRDQLAGLAALKREPYVDAQRIGVFGWSYGGTMTLMLLAQAPPGTFAAGVAVAPVTRYEGYDTHYTERYLGTPRDNPEGYRASSVLGMVDRLHGPLLLVHGMADDNVLFSHSTELMAALQARGVPFDLMTYPGGKHGLSGPAMTLHVNALIADYFDTRVKAAAARPGLCP